MPGQAIRFAPGTSGRELPPPEAFGVAVAAGVGVAVDVLEVGVAVDVLAGVAVGFGVLVPFGDVGVLVAAGEVGVTVFAGVLVPAGVVALGAGVFVRVGVAVAACVGVLVGVLVAPPPLVP